MVTHYYKSTRVSVHTQIEQAINVKIYVYLHVRVHVGVGLGCHLFCFGFSLLDMLSLQCPP